MRKNTIFYKLLLLSNFFSKICFASDLPPSELIKLINEENRPALNQAFDHGVDIETRIHGGLTLLHEAARQNKLDVLNFLLEKGASVSAENDENDTPVDLAAFKGHLSVISSLLSFGTVITERTWNNARISGAPNFENRLRQLLQSNQN